MRIPRLTSTIASAHGKLALAAIALLVATPALAQSPRGPRGFAKEGMYLGVAGLPNFTLDGRTFDGETLYQEIDGDEIDLLPRLDTQHMFRGVVGFRARPFALEFSYERTNHQGTFLDAPGEATFNSVNVDGRVFFMTAGRIQPHLVVGLALPWLTVVDGSSDDTLEVADARWRGPGLNTEVGITVFPHPRIGVSIGYAFRLIGFRRVKGISDEIFELKPPFKETSGSPVVMGFFTF
jgi:hypothetical protein